VEISPLRGVDGRGVRPFDEMSRRGSRVIDGAAQLSAGRVGYYGLLITASG